MKMKEFDKYLTNVKLFETSLWKYLASTSAIGLVLVIGQWDNFNKQFNAVTELCVVISGMAATLESFFSSLRKTSESKYDVLNYQPLFLGTRALGGLLGSALSFYLYYQYAVKSNEASLFFAMIGTYLFFRVISQSVKHLNILEHQSALWNSLTDDEREAWLERKKEISGVVSRLRKDIEIFAQEQKFTRLSIAEKVRQIDESKKQVLREKGGIGRFLAFIYPLTKLTLNLRGSLGLVTKNERTHLKDLAESKLDLMKRHDS